MNTKNILKTLALAMLIVPACNKSEIANEENTDKKGYALPVTVNVSRQGDEGTTRATFNESTKKLSFSAGDKLFVTGTHAVAGQFAGKLDYDAVSGKFSGTVTTQNDGYTGTIDGLMANASAFLLPDGYESYGFFSVGSGYNPMISFDFTKAFALTKADAVEQFSLEYAFEYSSGFALAPVNAIASFTISGLTANKEVAVSFDTYGAGVISRNVTTSAEGVATFAVGVSQGSKLENCTLTVDGNNIAMPNKTTEAGHIYNISRNLPAAEGAGKYFTSKSGGTKVVFSPGNLQYQASTNTWRFAEHQYDVVGSANSKTSSSYTGWIDLFGWGTSNKTFASGYGSSYQPWSTSTSGPSYGPTGTSNGLYGAFANGDWGVNMTGYTWRTLTGGDGGEWIYIFDSRASGATVNGNSNARYAKATINTDGTAVNGIILFPDGCKINSSSATTWGAINNPSNNYTTKCTTAQWSHLEVLGCVFLPAAGYRDGTAVTNLGSYGYYWSSSPFASHASKAHSVYFSSTAVLRADNNWRDRGHSVRLVREVIE